MKIEIEIKDNPRGRPPVKIVVDQAVHPKVHIRGVVSHLKRLHPWAKVIDIRIDLR